MNSYSVTVVILIASITDNVVRSIFSYTFAYRPYTFVTMQNTVLNVLYIYFLFFKKAKPTLK